MQEVPDWIFRVIEVEDLMCRNCKKRFTADNLMSIGIQESSNSPHLDTLCIGMFCTKCKELIIFELKEMSLTGFAFEILDHGKKRNGKENQFAKAEPRERKKKKSPKIRKSKITKKEIDEIRSFLKPLDLPHEEFLIALGMLPEEIAKYNYKK